MLLPFFASPPPPPILVARAYAPHKSSPAQTDRYRNIIQDKLHSLLLSYPHNVLGGDFTTMITPSFDGDNIHSRQAWDWLARKVTVSPPTLIALYRRFHPHQRAYTRYPEAHHCSESRVEKIFYSPPTASFLTPQSEKRFLVCSHLCLFLVYVFENLADFPQLKMKSTQR